MKQLQMLLILIAFLCTAGEFLLPYADYSVREHVRKHNQRTYDDQAKHPRPDPPLQ